MKEINVNIQNYSKYELEKAFNQRLQILRNNIKATSKKLAFNDIEIIEELFYRALKI